MWELLSTNSPRWRRKLVSLHLLLISSKGDQWGFRFNLSQPHLLHLGEINSRADLEDNDHNEDHGCEGPDDDPDDQRHCRGHSPLWFYLLHLLLILKRIKLSDLITILIIYFNLQWRSLQELGPHCISHYIPSLCSPERNSYRWSASGVRGEPCRKSHKNLQK